MQLSRPILSQLHSEQLQVPDERIFGLPEKVLQFGTGVLLRGLPDYFIDQANKKNLFNGRIVVVKSTAQGDKDAFNEQDGLYTLLVKGVRDGTQVEETMINASISRVLSAKEEWDKILLCASNPDLQIILSNTTEIGITLVASDAQTTKPVSFPGRVLAFLQERFRVFKGSPESGMVIVPTELITDNGTKLRQIIIQLAELQKASPAFMQWLTHSNDFCNSLVDCIVPGKPASTDREKLISKLGYTDELMIMSEPYRLWAIETRSDRTAGILSFQGVDPESVILAPDIQKFREIKLRLLNATHTLSCGLAVLNGFDYVRDAMQDADFVKYVRSLMLEEIKPLVVQENIREAEAEKFARQVIDRFSNPHIAHQWKNITAQYTSKMAMRVVPLIEKHFAVHAAVPEYMSMGFAAYLLVMRTNKRSDNLFYARVNGNEFLLQDDKASLLYHHWQNHGLETIAGSCLRDAAIFGADLTVYPGWEAAVTRSLILIETSGAGNALRSILAKKSVA
ncbi:MAG: tagaturonate reductase [Bacteroidota bacterium]|nr:tagaturonate reductase [Bacteroidota bacterium]